MIDRSSDHCCFGQRASLRSTQNLEE